MGMNTNELAWTAGLFEGEGCISIRPTKARNGQAVLSLMMRDEDSVRRFHRAMGFGTVRWSFPASRKNGIWVWTAYGYERVQAAVAFMWSGLGERRRARAREVLGWSMPQPGARVGYHGNRRGVSDEARAEAAWA